MVYDNIVHESSVHEMCFVSTQLQDVVQRCCLVLQKRKKCLMPPLHVSCAQPGSHCGLRLLHIIYRLI